MLGQKRLPFTIDFDRVIILDKREAHSSGLDLLQLEKTDNGIWSTDYSVDQVSAMFGNFDVEGKASGVSIFKAKVYTKWTDVTNQRDDVPENDNGRVDEKLLFYTPEFKMRDHLELFEKRPISLNFTPTPDINDWLVKEYVEFYPR